MTDTSLPTNDELAAWERLDHDRYVEGIDDQQVEELLRAVPRLLAALRYGQSLSRELGAKVDEASAERDRALAAARELRAALEAHVTIPGACPDCDAALAATAWLGGK